eukprot:scaffold2663_cov79-Isochrysis_galbana.AAC.1
MTHGYETLAVGLAGLEVVATTVCGKQAGSTHQMPSVSSSSVLPIFSTSVRAWGRERVGSRGGLAGRREARPGAGLERGGAVQHGIWVRGSLRGGLGLDGSIRVVCSKGRPCLLDDARPCVGDHSSHLHRVPPGPAAHHVAVKGIEDALVGWGGGGRGGCQKQSGGVAGAAAWG